MSRKYMLATIPVLLLLLSQVAYASLDVDVEVGKDEIHPLQSQIITVTSNERGVGVLFVLQPDEGTSWKDCLDEHPDLEDCCNCLSDDVKDALEGSMGKRVVSFVLVSFPQGGGSEIFVFPNDFTGINGEPSTVMRGTYKVIFVYLSWERTDNDRCCLFELDFDCTSFLVVPEVPLGAVVSLLAMLAAIPAMKYGKRIRLRKTD